MWLYPLPLPRHNQPKLIFSFFFKWGINFVSSRKGEMQNFPSNFFLKNCLKRKKLPISPQEKKKRIGPDRFPLDKFGLWFGYQDSCPFIMFFFIFEFDLDSSWNAFLWSWNEGEKSQRQCMKLFCGCSRSQDGKELKGIVKGVGID